MAKYDVARRYIPDRTNVVADAMSRVSHMEPASQGHKLPVIEVGTITSTLPATPEKLDEIGDIGPPERCSVPWIARIVPGLSLRSEGLLAGTTERI